MLSAIFFFSIFSSVVWIFYAFLNISNGEINQFAVSTIIFVLPLFVLWAIFGYIYQYISASVFNKNMFSLFKQMKKNQEFSDVIARTLLEARNCLQDNLILSKFDVFIDDMNELLADIIKRSQLVSLEQLDNLWIKVKNGGKWTFGKVIIEVAQAQPNLSSKLLQKALSDPVLSGTILEFCSRYQSLVNALEKHDQARFFLNIIETGVYGKVFSILATPADSIRQNRDLSLTHKQMSNIDEQESDNSTILSDSFSHNENIDNEPTTNETPSFTSNKLSENARRLFVNTFRKKDNESKNVDTKTSEKDPLSLAFAKSFGSKEETHFSFETIEDHTDTESNFETPEESSMPDINLSVDDEIESIPSVITPELTEGFQNTQDKLASIKKEWEEAKKRDLTATQKETNEEGMPEPKINNDRDFSYPFGGWMDTENYDK